jgi:membrane-associated phospholipid phosphatase
MRKSVISVACVCTFVSSIAASAQTAASPPVLAAPAPASFWAPFSEVRNDLVGVFTGETARILGAAAAGSMLAHRWDDDGMAIASRRFQPVTNFKYGNIGGGVTAQLGGAFAFYSIAKGSGSERAADVGADLIRAQVLSQAMVQTMKVAFRRERPDGSNRLSLPSGHTASAVATATVLSRHLGWKVGAPAYAASAYVAAARMAANRHHLTDVMVGAAVGVVAGRTVTVDVAAHRFALGVAPTVGGAAVTITGQ